LWEKEAAGEIARGWSGEEFGAKGETAVLGIAKRRPDGPAGLGCAYALLALYAVVFVLC